MTIKHNVRSRRIQQFSLFMVVAFGAVSLHVWFYARRVVPPQTKTSCSAYFGGNFDPVWPTDASEFLRDSYGVVIGTVLNPEVYGTVQNDSDPLPRIRITDVLKGEKMLHAGDTIRLCAHTGPVQFSNNNHTVLVYLEGMNNGVWVPLLGYVGIVPQTKDGRFKQEWANASDTSVTAQELQRLIK